MGKRSDFERKPRDFYPTPIEAVEPLISHLPREFGFAEPCAGDGQLCRHLEYFGGICTWASDIEPQLQGIAKNDYTEIGAHEVLESKFIITNPPWDRKILHPMIEHFKSLIPTWLLFDADWMHTRKSCADCSGGSRRHLRTATETKRRSRGVLVVKRQGGGGSEQSEHGCWGYEVA